MLLLLHPSVLSFAASIRLRNPFSNRHASIEASATAEHVLVIGSINVDLYHNVGMGTVSIDGNPIDISAIRGQTLPAASFVVNPQVATQLAQAAQLICLE